METHRSVRFGSRRRKSDERARSAVLEEPVERFEIRSEIFNSFERA